MCGRFGLSATPAAIEEAFPGFTSPGDWTPRYNIAPTQNVLAILNDGSKEMTRLRWGLIPSWAKDPEIGNRMINARCETLAEKPSYRTPLKKRRCLVIADGFYEWKKETGARGKTPFHIQLKSGAPFAFAGLWEEWNSPDGSPVRTCTIITTEPNRTMRPIHNRMPVILAGEDHPRWIGSKELSPDERQDILVPCPDNWLIVRKVSTFVNNPKNDSPECIAPLEFI